MSVLLARLVPNQQITPKDFAAQFTDDDFDGNASNQEMGEFCQLAWKCIMKSDKSIDRVKAVFSVTPLIGVQTSAAFPKLNVKIILFQVVLRLLKPERVNQGAFGICGPAHFAVLLLKSKPLTYLRMVIELLTKGKTVCDDGFEVVPDEYVRDFDPKGLIPQADWLLAASLRNAQAPIPVGKEGTYSGTHPTDVYGYCVHAGYREVILLSCYQRATDRMLHATPGISKSYAQFKPEGLKTDIERYAGTTKTYEPATNLQIACWLREQGWRVLLQSNGELFKYEPPTQTRKENAQRGNKFDQKYLADKEETWKSIVTEKTLAPFVYAQNTNHWVLGKKISIAAGMVKVSAYTWGGQKTINTEITLQEFSNAYGGFVAARG